jgi:uridine phosphorylase
LDSRERTTIEGDAVHITPQAFRAYVAGLRGVDDQAVRVPATIVGTFQPGVFERLKERTAAVPDVDGHRSAMLQRGTIGSLEVLVGCFPVGAPATAMYMEELIAFGARRFFFVGTAGSLQPSLPIGSLALATGAVRDEGTSFHYLPPHVEPRPAPTLLSTLQSTATARGHTIPLGRVWTIDAPYRELSAKVQRYAADGVLAVEMEAAAIFAVAEFRSVQAALLVAMSDELFHQWIPGFHSEQLQASLNEAVEIVLAAALAPA